MKNMLLELNKKGLINVVGVEGAIINQNAVTEIDVNNTYAMSRVIDFRGLFADTESKYGVVANKNDIIMDNGEVLKLKDVFSTYKGDKRKSVPKVADFVEIQNCFNGDAVLAVGTAIPKTSLKSMRGIIKEFDPGKGIFTVLVGGLSLKMPTICVRRVPRNIMSKSMKDIYEFMMHKGRKPVILPEYNFMDISECGKFITYIAEDRLSRFDGNVWDAELRKKYATQKKIRGVLKALFDCSDEDMETVIMLYGKTTISVEVLEGKELLQVFKRDNNSPNGSIGQSCMLGKNNSYFKIYEDNAKVAVVKDDNGKIILRAIIWQLYSDSSRKRITFMDRIYSSNDSMIPMLLNWAMKQGWYTLKSQTHSERNMVSPKGQLVPFDDFHAKLKEHSYENYPYVDTLYLICGNKAYASGHIGSAHSTSGGTSKI
ncbi:MAG: hypothetical protein ACRCX2_20390 [Paraclostridium sp.]